MAARGGKMKKSINRCFNAVSLHIVLKSDVLFPPNLKDSAVMFKCFSIYKFHCNCDICYIGHTTKRLNIRINQHIPPCICTNNLNHSIVASNLNPASFFGEHLLVPFALVYRIKQCSPYLNQAVTNISLLFSKHY